VDQQTALLMEYYDKSSSPSNIAFSTATVVANPGIFGAAYFLSAGSGSRLIVDPRQPLTFTNIDVKKCPVAQSPASTGAGHCSSSFGKGGAR
jgi:hypothetical protein